MLAVFDFLVIVIDSRFSELSKEIARIATVFYQKRVAIIKTQADRHVESMKREIGLSEAEAIERLRVGHRQDIASEPLTSLAFRFYGMCGEDVFMRIAFSKSLRCLSLP